ncbi:MAG: regulatory signaling modulator protein AmpE [Gammaproteobacteria bacterium]|nr:regulatory signaling modulator protein AmpE [Gammaproteobacteria bacterium]
MTFLSILIALLFERTLENSRPQRRHRWFDRYCSRLSSGGGFLRGLMGQPWGIAIALLPLLLAIGWLQALFNEFGGLFALVFGSAVLLYSLGPGDLGEEVGAYLAARDAGDDQQAASSAQQLCLSEIPDAEPRRSFAVARAVVVLANRRLLAPIFWFVLFGAVGAAAYRMLQLIGERLHAEDGPQEMQQHSDRARQIADWAPARLTAFSYAVAGNFDAVAHAWRTFEHIPLDGPLSEADHLLAHTGLAALDTFPDDADELDDSSELDLAPVVEDALALVWRSLTIWVVVIGAGSLVAALA